MIEDFRQFLKVYRMYKKGKREMDKAKEWITEHKKELMYTAAGIIIFRAGYRCGWRTYKKVVRNTFNTMYTKGYNVVRLINSEVQ